MFSILHNFKTANSLLLAHINKLKKNGYHIFLNKHKLDDQYTLDKITIKSPKKTRNRLVFSSGLHGVEGYVGHAAIHTFFSEILSTLDDSTEVVIYPTLNPYGMNTLQRTNKNNVDLNRNFSKNDFTSENKDFLKVLDFISPREFKSSMVFNTSFYFDLGKLIRKNGVATLNSAFLLGQNIEDNSIYFSGTGYQDETLYIMNEFNTLMKTKIPLTWIDIHSGYGPKKQMSIINSRHEMDVTRDMIDNLDYPLILGINEDDIYDTDGDIIEKLYDIRNSKFPKVDFYGTCFEFGTTGEGTAKSIKSLKAIIAMNHVRFIENNRYMKDYAVKLMKDQFAPTNQKWRAKAHQDFIQAINAILKYKKLVK